MTWLEKVRELEAANARLIAENADLSAAREAEGESLQPTVDRLVADKGKLLDRIAVRHADTARVQRVRAELDSIGQQQYPHDEVGRLLRFQQDQIVKLVNHALTLPTGRTEEMNTPLLIETRDAGSAEWGISVDGPNPTAENYVGCANRQDAERCIAWLQALEAELAAAKADAERFRGLEAQVQRARDALESFEYDEPVGADIYRARNARELANAIHAVLDGGEAR